jgi:hypothetical protein
MPPLELTDDDKMLLATLPREVIERDRFPLFANRPRGIIRGQSHA